MYWLLLIGCLLLFALSWWLEGARLAAPSVIVSFCLSLVSAMALLGLGRWNTVVMDLHGETVAAILLGCVMFVLGCQFINLVYNRGFVRAPALESSASTTGYSVHLKHLKALTFICAIASLLWYLLVGRAVGAFDPITISAALKGGEGDFESTIATGLRCLTYACCALGCALLGWAAASKRADLLKLSILLIVCSIIPSAVSAIRTNVLHVLVGAVVAYSMAKLINGRRGGVRLRTIFVVFVGAYLLVQLFYITVQFSGRAAYYSSPVDYIEFYLAGGVPALDDFIARHTTPTGVSETFWGVQDLLSRAGLIDSPALKASNQWAIVNYTYDGVTNIYTFVRPALHDFGFVGMCFYLLVLGMFFQVLYRRAITRHSLGAFLTYSYLSYILVETMRDDFFSYWLGLEGITTLVILGLVAFCVFYRSRASVGSYSIQGNAFSKPIKGGYPLYSRGRADSREL